MRKTSFFVLVGVLAVVLLTAGQCVKSEKINKRPSKEECVTSYFEWADSVERGEAKVRVAFHCVLPIGEGSALADSVQAWVLPLIGDSTLVARFLGGAAPKDSVSLASLFDEMGQQKMAEARENFDAPEVSDDVSSAEDDVQVEVAYEDKERVTYLFKQYWYGGGAHGGYTLLGATFSKADGHRMGYDELLPGTSETEIREMLVEGLMEYMECDTEMELKENLFLDYGDDADRFAPIAQIIPLPMTAPWMEVDGVHLQYQEYEIGCYAIGMPLVVIKPKKQQ